jgi:hypothetical protein
MAFDASGRSARHLSRDSGLFSAELASLAGSGADLAQARRYYRESASGEDLAPSLPSAGVMGGDLGVESLFGAPLRDNAQAAEMANSFLDQNGRLRAAEAQRDAAKSGAKSSAIGAGVSAAASVGAALI